MKDLDLRSGGHVLGFALMIIAIFAIGCPQPVDIAATMDDPIPELQALIDSVVADDGRSWVGPPAAYLVVMWAVRGTRALSFVLSLPVLSQLTGRVFQTIAGNRHLLGKVTGEHCERCTV